MTDHSTRTGLKWGIVGNIVMAWVLTIPVCMVIAAVLYLILPF